MGAVFYTAIVEQAGDGYSLFFPDVPGCTSAGRTLQEAAMNAEQALAGHLIAAAEYGEVVPDPRDLDAIPVDPEVREAARILIRAERPGRSVRLNVTLDEGLVAAIDKVARNRSGFLADAARAALAARRP